MTSILPEQNGNILWGAAATALVGATLADWQKKREEEARRLAELEAKKAGNAGRPDIKAMRQAQRDHDAAVRARWAAQAQASSMSTTNAAMERKMARLDEVEDARWTASQAVIAQRTKEKEKIAFDQRMDEHDTTSIPAPKNGGSWLSNLWNAGTTALAGVLSPAKNTGGGKLAIPALDDDPPKWWEKAVDWVDNNQVAVSVGIGVAIGLGALAIIATGGLATPLVIGGAAVIAAGLTAGGTAALNTYYDRPITQNLIRNAGTAATSATVTAVAPGVFQAGQTVVSLAATNVSMYAYALGASWVGSATTFVAPAVGVGWSLWTLGSLGAIGYGLSLASDPTLSQDERQDGAIIGAVGAQSLEAAVNVYETADLINKMSAFNVTAFDRFQELGTWRPNRDLDDIPGPMLPDDKLVTLPGGNLDDLPLGTAGDKNTVLLWTGDERGINFIPEQTSWPTSRPSQIDPEINIISHTNISDGAIAGGEAWHTGPNEVTMTSASGAYGHNWKKPETWSEGEIRFDAAVEFLRSTGVDVIKMPFGTRPQ